MIRIRVMLFLLVAVKAVYAGGPDQVIACHVDHLSFEKFSAYIFEKSAVRIYYHDSWVDSISVTIHDDHLTVFDAVSLAIAQTPLKLSVWNNDLVLLPDDVLITMLPAFERKKAIQDSITEREREITLAEEKYLTGRMSDVIQAIEIGQPELRRSKATVSGRILDEETGEPVSFATMYISELDAGFTSDINGYIALSVIPGKYNALFEFLGYKKKRYLLDILSDGTFTIQLSKAITQLNELVIQGDRQVNMQLKDPGLEKISMKSIKDLPMIMGERNILSVSALLPGIVTAGEGAAGLNVRGGNSDQNAFYLNKIPIYNTSHLFGFFPAFNSDMIKDFSIYKGYIPAQYGGRLSSIFNILTRKGNLRHFAAHGGISPITANVVIEGSIKRDTCSFLLSARSSYSDWILKQLHDPTIRASKAQFYDLAGSFHYDVQKTQLTLFAYRSEDHFRLADLNTYEYSNSGISATLGHRYSTSLRSELSLIGSQYAFSTTDKQEATTSYEHAYKLKHYEARLDFTNVLTDKNTLEYGAALVYYGLDRGTVIPFGNASLRKQVELGEERGIESALYISDTYVPLEWLTLTGGFRMALFNPRGPKTVYSYADGLPREAENIADSILYGNGKSIKTYSEPDIRGSVNIKTDVYGSVKLAFNQMHQNLFLLNNIITIAPNAQWKLADYHLKPSASNQVSAGVFRLFPNLGLDASVEFYYKRTQHNSEFKDGADFLGSPLTETLVLQGDQRAYGFELYIKRTARRLEGWLSYTYSRSKVQVDGLQPWEKINEGKVFPANFDIPHSLNIAASYKISRRVTVASIIAFQSGKPITYPISVYYVDGVPTLQYSSRNAYRIPDYFRSDLSMTFEGNLKKDKFIHSSFILNVYNVSGRENPYSVFFNSSEGRIHSFKYSVIGVPVFTASWIFKLGNYASE